MHQSLFTIFTANHNRFNWQTTNNITNSLTNQISNQSIYTCTIYWHYTQITRLWWWLPLRLSLTQTIVLHLFMIWILGSNHLWFVVVVVFHGNITNDSSIYFPLIYWRRELGYLSGFQVTGMIKWRQQSTAERFAQLVECWTTVRDHP